MLLLNIQYYNRQTMVITTSTAHVAHIISPMIGYCRHCWLPIRWLGSQQQASMGPSECVGQFILLDQYNKTFAGPYEGI